MPRGQLRYRILMNPRTLVWFVPPFLEWIDEKPFLYQCFPERFDRRFRRRLSLLFLFSFEAPAIDHCFFPASRSSGRDHLLFPLVWLPRAPLLKKIFLVRVSARFFPPQARPLFRERRLAVLFFENTPLSPVPLSLQWAKALLKRGRFLS